MYKQSKYNFLKTYENDNVLIYNLVSNNAALLDAQNYSVYKSINNADILKNSEICIDLFNAGFIVEKEKNEEAFVNSRRHSVLYGLFHHKLFTVLPTTDCNARCYYCYQDDWKPEYMTEETANDVVEFIKKNTDNEDKITINWFGGEPLYNLPIIRKINSQIKENYADKYTSTMTSNGSLITQNLAQEMKNDWNLTGIQITVDNLNEKYNNVKKYVDGKAFIDVINAIEVCLKNEIRVSTRINICKDNINDLESICSYLSNKFGNSQYFSMYAACLSSECSNCYSHTFYQESEYKKIHEIFLEVKYKFDKNPKADNYIYPLICTTCSAKTNYSFVIDPKGDLYKCQHLHKEDCVGNVKSGIIFNNAMEYFLNPNINENCEKCKFLPACHGGCPNSKKHGLEVGGICREIKYDIQKRLDIIYDIFSKERNKGGEKNDNAIRKNYTMAVNRHKKC